MDKPGILIDIPGFGKRHIRMAVSDYTGTHSFGGAIEPDVKTKLRELAALVDLHIVTADSFGTAESELAGIAIPYKLRTGRHDIEKAGYVSQFDLRCVAAFGNGNNDRLMLKAVKEGGGLAIAVDNGEGCAIDGVSRFQRLVWRWRWSSRARWPMRSPVIPVQDLPNMGQQITPLAPQGSRFDMLNPDLSDRPDWLASQAATSVVSPDRKTMLVLTSGFNRVYSLGVPAPPYPWYTPDSNEYVFIYDISSRRRSRRKWSRSQIATTGLSSIHPARRSTWPAAPVTMSTSLPGAPPEPGGRRKVRRWPWATMAWALA
jgi:soluble P-type ATPase